MTDIQSARRILLCLRYGIGDVVMETPVLEALRNLVPKAFIRAIGASPALELLEKDPRVDELVSIQDWGLTHWGDNGTAEIRKGLRRWLQRERHDLILDPSHAVIALRETLQEQDVPILDTVGEIQKEALAASLEGVEAIKAAVKIGWGLNISPETKPRLHLSGGVFRSAERFIGLSGCAGRPLMAVSPVSSSSLKAWPMERLAEVADRLVDERGGRILLFSGPQAERAPRILGPMRHSEKVIGVGNLHLQLVAGLLSYCDLLVCNDTGLMHMAAAVGTPVVAVFGPTSPSLYLPDSAGSRAVGAIVDCPHRKTQEFGPSPCIVVNRCLTGRRSCIDLVTVHEVLEKTESILREDPRGRKDVSFTE